MIKYLNELMTPYGVSGNEDKIRGTIKGLIEPFVDEIKVDNLGNLIAIKKYKNAADKGKKTERIMFAAHMDTIGIIATFVDEKGFVRFSKVGGVDVHIANGQRVVFDNGIVGVVYYEEEIQSIKDLKFGKMFIDIGASSRDEALGMINIGDKGYFSSEPFEQNGNLISHHIDDRVGCAILVNVAEEMANCSDDKMNGKEICYVFTVQEELGLRGAGPAAYGVNPDVAVIVDVTYTGDIPGCAPMEVSLGKGPAIKIKDRSVICSSYIIERLKATANILEIPYQLEIMEDGGTDAGAIHKSAGGILTGGVSIPTRYVHTPNEMCNLKDVEQACKLLIGFCGN